MSFKVRRAAPVRGAIFCAWAVVGLTCITSKIAAGAAETQSAPETRAAAETQIAPATQSTTEPGEKLTAVNTTLPPILSEYHDAFAGGNNFVDDQLELFDKTRQARLKTDEKPWRVSITLGGGVTTDPQALGNSSLLPSHGSYAPSTEGASESATGLAGIRGEYDLIRTKTDKFTVSLAGIGNFYTGDQGKYDLLDGFFFFNYQHVFTPEVKAGIHIGTNLTMVGGEFFRNEVIVNPIIAVREASWATSEIGYSFSQSTYGNQATLPADDRDGNEHSYFFKQHLTVPNTGIKGFVGYAYGQSHTTGQNFSGEESGFIYGLEGDGPYNSRWEFSHRRIATNFENDYLVRGVGGAITPTKRRDTVDIYSLLILQDVTDNLTVFLEYDYVRDNSSMEKYNYDKHTVIFGIIYSF